jgi:putative ABC transport system permease protein
MWCRHEPRRRKRGAGVNLFSLAVAYLRSRLLASVLQVLLLAIGLAAIVVMLLVSTQLADRVERDTRGAL